MKYKEEFTLATIGLLSSIGVLVASTDPLLSVLQDTLIESILVNDFSGNSIIFNLSIGVLVSTIFYIMMVYIPEKRKQKQIDPTIFNLIEKLISSGSMVALEVSNQANASTRFASKKDFTEADLLAACHTVDPKRMILPPNSGIPAAFNKTKGAAIRSRWEQTEHHCDQLVKYIQFVDTGLITEINKLSDCFLRYEINLLGHPNVNNTDMSVHSKGIFDYHQQVKAIAVYYKKNINTSYQSRHFDL
ncbi:hypothetical protein [Vibrio profundi]|uniref:hypothetical protein n=1 Tax=Vibrio profundi TaxID=1774960 RepID=UPI003735B56C